MNKTQSSRSSISSRSTTRSTTRNTSDVIPQQVSTKPRVSRTGDGNTGNHPTGSRGGKHSTIFPSHNS